MSTSQSLQQSEAQARAAQLDVTSYDVSLDLAGEASTFGSVTRITFESAGGPTFLDLKPTRVNRIRFNDTGLDADLFDRGRLPLETLPGTNYLEVDAVMPFRNDGEGLHRSVDPADGRHYVYGMSFMDAAPTIFACFDQPDLKAPYTFHVRAPHDWTVIGNAPGRSTEPGVWELDQSQPLSTYFVTLVAGPYHVIHDHHDGIPLGLSSRASLAGALDADAEELLTMTRQCFNEFHRLFGIRYPFGDYHQAFVPEFNAGAMENPGCVTFRDQMLFDSRVTRGERVQRATTVAHEMAHQWFGNITTPVWWDDLWLNESFAEYMGNRVTADATEYGDAWTHASWARRQWGLRADQRPSTHPVAGNGAADAVLALQNFDGISYAKGSSILKQLAATLGDAVFFTGTLDHFTRHFFGNATMHDLFASWERAGAHDLSPVIDQWLRTAGPDVFTVDRDRSVLLRTPPADHPTDREHTFRVARLEDGTHANDEVRVTGPETPVQISGALVLDSTEQGWAVHVPDDTTMLALVTELPHVTDPMLQAAAWNNIKSGFSLGRVAPDAVVDLLTAAFPVEDTEDTGRHTMPWVLGEVLPAASPGSRARVHAASREALDAAEPGSELQLSAFRSVIHTSEDTHALVAWLSDAGGPQGIEVDRNVRWRLLTRLAGLGAIDRAALDAELDADRTVTGRVRHARAVPALPTAEAKAFAWERFTGEVDVPNYELQAAGLGLWDGGHSDLTAPYVERYFADLPGTAEIRTGWVLALTAEAYFPRTAVDQRTVDRARDLLAGDALTPAVARRVIDAVDDLERALAVRAAFPTS